MEMTIANGGSIFGKASTLNSKNYTLNPRGSIVDPARILNSEP